MSKVNTEANEKLQTQIDASIGVTRSLIESWLPAPKPGEKLDDDDEDDDIMTKYSTGRPDRLGLGAKFLSHADAMRHQQTSSSKEEMMLRNKILNQNQKKADKHTHFKRNKQEDSDSDEEESRTSMSKKKKKIETNQTNNPSSKKKIGNQGDFLSMYLSERAGKKKGKKK